MHTRKCSKHGEHGIFYICPDYSSDIQDEIKSHREIFSSLVKSGEIMVVTKDRSGNILSEVKLKDYKDERIL